MSCDKATGTRGGLDAVSTQCSHGLDQQYDLRAAFPDYVDFFEQWRSRSEQARTELKHILDVRYGQGRRDLLDVFPAPRGNGRLLVFVHGGYWRFMDKSDFSFVVVPYVSRGVSVALLNYALFPGTKMSTVVDQVCNACSWLAANADRYGIPFKEFHLAGWSAGAHLSTMIACSRHAERCAQHLPDISTVLAISGIYDLRPLLQTSANAYLQLNEGEARRNSPIHMRPPSGTRIAVVWGGDETEAIARALAALFCVGPRQIMKSQTVLKLTAVFHSHGMKAPQSGRLALLKSQSRPENCMSHFVCHRSYSLLRTQMRTLVEP